jgi:hypothetical protein
MTGETLSLFLQTHWITITCAGLLFAYVVAAWSMYVPRKGQWRFEDSPEGALRRQFMDGDMDRAEYKRRHAELEKINRAA